MRSGSPRTRPLRAAKRAEPRRDRPFGSTKAITRASVIQRHQPDILPNRARFEARRAPSKRFHRMVDPSLTWAPVLSLSLNIVCASVSSANDVKQAWSVKSADRTSHPPRLYTAPVMTWAPLPLLDRCHSRPAATNSSIIHRERWARSLSTIFVTSTLPSPAVAFRYSRTNDRSVASCSRALHPRRIRIRASDIEAVRSSRRVESSTKIQRCCTISEKKPVIPPCARDIAIVSTSRTDLAREDFYVV